MWSAQKLCNKNETWVLPVGESYNNYYEILGGAHDSPWLQLDKSNITRSI